MLEEVDNYIRTVFSPFVSSSTAPRKPNFNPLHLLDVIRAVTLADRACNTCRPKSAPEWCGFIEWCNAEVMRAGGADLEPAIQKLRRRRCEGAIDGRRPFVMTCHDPTHGWAASVEWFSRWSTLGNRAISIIAHIDVSQSSPSRVRPPTTRPALPKRRAIPIALRHAVWNTHAGGAHVGTTECACCGVARITQQDFECGHIIAHANGGGTNIANLLPVCRSCNRSMGVNNLETFRSERFGWGGGGADAMDIDVPPPAFAS